MKIRPDLVQEANEKQLSEMDTDFVNDYIDNVYNATMGAKDIDPALSPDADKTPPRQQPEGIEEEIQASDFMTQFAENFFQQNGSQSEEIINNIDSSALTRERDTLL
jgi:hypothetical protein